MPGIFISIFHFLQHQESFLQKPRQIIQFFFVKHKRVLRRIYSGTILHLPLVALIVIHYRNESRRV